MQVACQALTHTQHTGRTICHLHSDAQSRHRGQPLQQRRPKPCKAATAPGCGPVQNYTQRTAAQRAGAPSRTPPSKVRTALGVR